MMRLPSPQLRQGNRLTLLLVCLLVSGPACRRQAVWQGGADTSAPPRARVAEAATGLDAWLLRIPDDATWAVMTSDLPSWQRWLASAWPILSPLPDFKETLRELRKAVIHRWGSWPLNPKRWAEIGVKPGSGALVYARPRDPKGHRTTVFALKVATPKAALGALLKGLRRLGARSVEPLGTLPAGQAARWRFDGRWSCGLQAGHLTCADVPPASWTAAVTVDPRRSLAQRRLRRSARADRLGSLGVYLSPALEPDKWLAAPLGSLRPDRRRGLWISATAGTRLKVNALLLGNDAKGTPGPTSSPSLPLGLGIGQHASILLRARLPLSRLVKALSAWLPPGALLDGPATLRPAGALKLLRRILTGELLLASTPAGLAILLAARSKAAVKRALRSLDLLITPLLPRWQATVRSWGAGWDLRFQRNEARDRPAYCLRLSLPQGADVRAASTFPEWPDGALELCWAASGKHLLVATNSATFPELKAQASLPNRSARRSLAPQAVAQLRDSASARLALWMTVDDPLSSLPPSQGRLLARRLASLPPAERRLASALRLLADLSDDLSLAWVETPAGPSLRASLGLLGGSARGVDLPRPYLEALQAKYSGYHEAYRQALSRLTAAGDHRRLATKAARQLAGQRGAGQRGLAGLLTAVLLPWWDRHQDYSARRGAREHLKDLAGRVRALEAKARDWPPARRQRWHRGLKSTPPGPVDLCCQAPGQRCRVRAEDWRHPTWKLLGWRLQGQTRFRYQLLARPGRTRDQLLLRALGDLNCDGRGGILELPLSIDRGSGKLTRGPLRQLRPDK